MRVRVLVGLTVWATTTWGCGAVGDPTIDASDYEQSCSSNMDCVPVREGDACSTCDCPNAAVNVSDEEAFSSEYDELRGSCGPMPAIACDCPGVVTYCALGDRACALRERIEREPTAFDQSCQADSDCVAVRSGEVCSACGCPDAAINGGALDAFRALGEGVDCGVTVLDCAQCEAPAVACQDSVCVVVDS